MKVTTASDVRARPGMYVGDTDDGSGILNMALELVGNALDQHLLGRCTRLELEIERDGTLTVEDDGPGLPARSGGGVPALDTVLTQLSTAPTVDGHRPHVHLGLGGLGLFVVNALCEHLEVISVHDGIEATARCARGELLAPVRTAAATRPSGTRVRLRPDPLIFARPRIPRGTLAHRLEDLSFLAPGLDLSWRIAGDQHAGAGLVGRVALDVPCPADQVASHRATYQTPSGPIDVEVALAWRTDRWRAAQPPAIDSFVNFARTREHGCHVDGVLDGVRGFGGGGLPEDRTAGLVAAVSVLLTDVKYGSPTKDRLCSPEARPAVRDATSSALASWAATS